MKNQYIMICFFILFTTYQSNAQRYDYQWAFGYDTNEEHRFGISLIDFNNGEVDVSYYGKSEDYGLGFAGSFINDIEGQLYLHTNNCYIKDKYWITISGDSLLTPTGSAANTCTDGKSYGALQSSILLPDLADNSLTYLIHKDLILDFENEVAYSENIRFTTVESNQTSTHTISHEKSVILRLTSCPNKLKNKWWVLIPKFNSNIFVKYTVANKNMLKLGEQAIGPILKAVDLDIGQAQYSPDGSMFAVNTEEHGVLLYDFNNETGELSNFRSIPYPDSHNVAQGLCFSSNSRFIYVTTAENLLQIDLDEDNEIINLGYESSVDGDNWPVGLGMMFMGPDCKIYVSPGWTTYYLHVIKEPNKKGSECDFAERIIELPTNIPHDLPNIPQYRYLSGCDSTISFPFVSSIERLPKLKSLKYSISPNPISDNLNISFNSPLIKCKSMVIFNNLGRKVMALKIKKGESFSTFDVSELPIGLYFLQDIEEGFTSKLVKI